jgi:U3 small nucleolar ribonucleoprotein protein LCP5
MLPAAPVNAEDDAMAFRPNPAALVPALEVQDPENAVYRPPKLAPAAMDEPEPRGRVRQDERKQQAALRQAANNQYIRDLEAEIGGAPEELRETGGGGAGDGVAFLKEKQKLEARARIEEDLMV